MPAPLRRLKSLPPAAAALAGLALLAAAPLDHHEKGEAAEVKTVEVAAGDLTLTVPETWEKQPLASRMRAAQFLVPAAEGVEEPTELAVFAPMGGSDEANLRRWVDQFVAQGRTVSIVRGDSREGAYKLLDVSGTYNAPDGPPMMRKTIAKPGSRMLAAIVAVEGQGNYFLKMPGPAKTVAAQTDAFRALIGAKEESEKPYELE